MSRLDPVEFNRTLLDRGVPRTRRRRLVLQAKRLARRARRGREAVELPEPTNMAALRCRECNKPMSTHPKPSYMPCPIAVIDGVGVYLGTTA